MVNWRWLRNCICYFKRVCSWKKINSVEEFIKTLSLVNKFSEGTLRCKIQNIKCILDEYNLDNSLKVSSLANYSKQNKEQFLRACHDLDIIL